MLFTRAQLKKYENEYETTNGEHKLVQEPSFLPGLLPADEAKETKLRFIKTYFVAAVTIHWQLAANVTVAGIGWKISELLYLKC